MDFQTLLIFPVIVVAVFYVGRSLWPRREKIACASCPQNRQRADDYV